MSETNTPEMEKPEETKEIQKKDSISKEITLKEGGLIQAKNFEQQFRLAEFYVKSGMLPKQYNSPAKVITGMQYASELGLKPLTALKSIAVINGTPSLYGDLPLALVRASGKLESIREVVFDDQQKEINLKNKNLTAKPFGAACTIKRKGETKQTAFFTIAEAQEANLFNKDVWKHYTKTMLKYRARSIVLKDVFSDILAGISIAEYDHNDMAIGDRGPISDDPETKAEIKETMTPEKLDKIKEIDRLMIELKYNEAQSTRYIKQYLNCEDPHFAKMEDLEKLYDFLVTENIAKEYERG